jgi:F-type H+-transporting ATPase subunit delta
MKDLQTIARPYAKAIFELALKHQTIKEWSGVLAVLAAAIDDTQMQKLLDHPDLTEKMLVDVLLSIVEKQLKSKTEMKLVDHALSVMAEHHRLAVISEVSRQFEGLRAEHEKMCSGTVYTSIQLDDKQLLKLEAGLKKKLNKTVHLTQVVQPALLGGARVQIGDMVIDGTLRGRLERLSQALLA